MGSMQFKVVSYDGSRMEPKRKNNDFYDESGTENSSRINLGMVNDTNSIRDMESNRQINMNELQALLGN